MALRGQSNVAERGKDVELSEGCWSYLLVVDTLRGEADAVHRDKTTVRHEPFEAYQSCRAGGELERLAAPSFPR